MVSNLETDLKNIERETTKLSELDGFYDILVGVIALFFSLDFLFDFPAYELRYLILIVLILLLIKAKEWFTYPRLGYFKPKSQSKKINFGVLGFQILVILLAVSIIAIYTSRQGNLSSFSEGPMILVISGSLMVMSCIYLIITTGGRKYYFIIIMTFISSIFLSTYESLSSGMRIGLLLLIWGLIFLTIGVMEFRSFIRNYPKLNPA